MDMLLFGLLREEMFPEAKVESVWSRPDSPRHGFRLSATPIGLGS